MTRLIKKISSPKTEQTQRKIFGLFAFSIIFMIGFYLYSINIAITETVNRKNNLESIRIMESKYQKVEESYFVFLNKFDIDYTYSLGFVDQNKIDFVFRPSAFAKR